MKCKLRRLTYRVLMSIIPLTMIACGLGGEPSSTVVQYRGSTEASEDTVITVDAETSDATSQYSLQRAARTIATRDYSLVRTWLKTRGLVDHSHSELLDLAESDTAAAKYVNCHEGSSTRGGMTSRLTLLATCLEPELDTEIRATAVEET